MPNSHPDTEPQASLPALVYGVHEPVALGIMAGLARAGVRVIGASHDRRAVGFRSRFCSESRVCPDVLDGSSALVHWLTTELPPSVLVPVYDPFPTLIAEFAEQLRARGHRFLLPALGDMQAVTEKDRLARLAADDPDLPAPESRTVDDADLDAAAAELTFPCVLKIVHPWNKLTRRVLRASDLAAEYRALAQALHERGVTGYRVLAQRWIQGDRIVHVTQLIDARGERVCGLLARRVRVNCTRDGAERDATLLERIELPDLAERAWRFAVRHGLHGIMEFDCKQDVADGKFRILDANQRFWAWNAFAARCGVNYAAAYHRTALGLTWRPAPQRSRPRWHWRAIACSPYSPDLWACFSLWRLGRASCTSLAGSSLALAARAVLRPASVSIDFGEWRDPRPRLWILVRMVRDVVLTLTGIRRKR